MLCCLAIILIRGFELGVFVCCQLIR